jgi:hypothetical protein
VEVRWKNANGERYERFWLQAQRASDGKFASLSPQEQQHAVGPYKSAICRACKAGLGNVVHCTQAPFPTDLRRAPQSISRIGGSSKAGVLEMNSIRTDLCYMYAHSAEFEQVCAEEFEPFGVDANAGARALWLAIEEALNDVKYEYAPENVGAWRDPKELLAGPQTYIFDDIEYYKLEPVEVRWKNANGERYERF